MYQVCYGTNLKLLIGLRNLKWQVEKKFECKIKVFRSDSGGEYVSTEFKRFISSNEIIHLRYCAYTPKQNGVAERKRKTGTYCCSSQMLQMHVPKYLWAEASSSICHQQNSIWCYHKGKIPWEIFHEGASALCPDSLRDQLSPKAHCSVHIAFCILLGYSPAMLWSSYDFISFGMLHSWRMSLCILHDPPHALPNLSTDVRLSSSLGSAPGKTCSSSVAPQSGDDSDDLGHSDHLFGKWYTQKSELVRAAPDELDQPSPAASLPSPSASSGKTIEVSSSPSISFPSTIIVRRSALIYGNSPFGSCRKESILNLGNLFQSLFISTNW